VIACSLGGSAEDIKGGDPAKLPIASAHLGNAGACAGSRGDMWTTTWADDHQLYSASDDTTGFDNACSSNLAVHSIVGETPPNLPGKTVNPMKQFGAWAEVNPGDGASWKASGLVSVDGVLYLSKSVIIIRTKGSPSLISFRKPGTPASSSLPTREEIGAPRRKSARPCSRPSFQQPLLRSARQGRKRQNEQPAASISRLHRAMAFGTTAAK
jgi:hypothetical protein